MKDLAQSLCSGATEDKQLAFSTAVAKGGQGAVDAVAALIYAQTQLKCLGKQELFDIIPPAKSRKCRTVHMAESCCRWRGPSVTMLVTAICRMAKFRQGACECALGCGLWQHSFLMLVCNVGECAQVTVNPQQTAPSPN